MRRLATIVLLSATLALSAQTEKSAAPLNPPSGGRGVTRAVVIGISDYADDRIPDLNYAHVDAAAFAEYLRSPAGGSLPNDRIALLTNEQATAGKIIAALEWLIAESTPGDRALLYFSGHGDVERVTKFQRGYLLCYDAPGTTYMAGGSLPVGFLGDVVTTLSEANVQVVVISDACRSGKLAGSANGGTQATTAALVQQFANEIKILSCQPEEFSIEGREWGGGRGCFSYHLVDALTGLADGNDDGTVNLMETGRYLEERVPEETAPHTQIPMTIGNRRAILAAVQPAALAALRERRKGQSGTLSPIDAKGLEDMVLVKTDSSARTLYAAFTAALQRGDLMTPPGASANDFYEKLLPTPGIEKLKGLMTRNLAAALQDEAQIVINQILRTDPQIVDDAFSPVSKYDHLPAYLHRAAELLGEGHFMWRFIKAREYYFKAKACRKENFPELTPDSVFHLALAKLDTALLFDEEAAYAWFEKGYLGFWNGMEAESILDFFAKASLRSAGWLLLEYYTGRTLGTFDFDSEKGIAILRQVVATDSMFLPAYRELGFFTQDKIWFEAYVRKMHEYEQTHSGKVPAIYYNYLGSCLMQLQRNEEAVRVLLHGADLSNHQHPLIYTNLGRAYSALEQYEDAEKAFQKALEINPLIWSLQAELSLLKFYHLKTPVEEVKHSFRQLLRLNPYQDVGWFYLTAVFLQNGQTDSAEYTALQWLSVLPNAIESHLAVGYVYRLNGKPDEARQIFQKALSCCDREDPLCLFNKLIALNALGKTDSFEILREKFREAVNNPSEFHASLAIVYAFNDQDAVALECFEQAFQQGGKRTDEDILFALQHPVTFRLSQTPEFKALMKKYFPDQFKD